MRSASLGLVLIASAAAPLPGQAPTEVQVVSPATLGLFVYPAKNQAPPQQQQDEGECYVWARQQTGIDPTAPPPAAAAAQAPSKAEGTLKGAAGGAAVGTAIGAIAGDTGEGAAIGAVAGAVRGRRQAKNAQKQATQQAQQQAQGQQAQTRATFNKAMSACLEGRGYSVK
jgi:hypothetical protein